MAKKGNDPDGATRVPIRMNQGTALKHLADVYCTLAQVILEILQKAIDEGAKNILVKLDYKAMSLVVRDDGKGTTLQRFDAALQTIADPKRKGEGKLGKFGLGLISPLGKCTHFVFCSLSPDGEGFNEWRFNCAELLAAKDGLNVARSARPDYTTEDPAPPGKTKVKFVSEMVLHGIVKDTQINAVDPVKLRAEITSRFGVIMKQNDTSVCLRVTGSNGELSFKETFKAVAFQGMKLPEMTVTNNDGGFTHDTLFNLYVTRVNGARKKSGVLVGIQNDPFRLPLAELERDMAKLVDEHTFKALTSGVFEGEIITNGCVLRANRKGFEKTDGFVSFCVAIEEWFKAHGSAEYSRVSDDRTFERYERLGGETLAHLEGLLKLPEGQGLKSMLQSFEFGKIGNGHVKVRTTGVDDLSTIAVNGAGSIGNGTKGTDTDDGSKSEPKTEHPGHIPLMVTSKNGSKRSMVKGGSTGITLLYELVDSGRIYDFNIRTGVLTINIIHDAWARCEGKDDVLLAFQQNILLMALTVYQHPEGHDRTVAENTGEEYLKALSLIMTTRPSTKKTNK